MPVEIFNATSLPQDSLSPASEYLLAKWKTLKATNGLTLQRLTEEASYPISESATYMIATGDDFAYMYVGTTLQMQLGINPTGMLLSHRSEPIAGELSTTYRRVLDIGTPMILRYIAANDGRFALWQRLVLPLQTSGVDILVCFSEIVGQKNDVFDYLFEIAPAPLIVFYPTRDERLRINDGWIVAANPAALTFVGSDTRIDGGRLRDHAIFESGDFWVLVRQAAAMAQPRAAARMPDFSFEIIKFQHLLTLRVTGDGMAGHAAI